MLQKSLGDFAITYELNAHCDRPNEMNAIYTEMHRNILDVFNEYGVAIMTLIPFNLFVNKVEQTTGYLEKVATGLEVACRKRRGVDDAVKERV